MTKKILIVSSADSNSSSETLERIGYGKAVVGLGTLTDNLKEFFNKPKKFGLVLFTGGADVDPSLYNDTSPHNLCYSDITRDRHEKVVFKYALRHKIPMTGICRGVQFLNVMAGGELMHHIDGHEGVVHEFSGPRLKTSIKVNSFHHQMVIPANDSHVIGWSKSRLSNRYYGKNDEREEWNSSEVEAVIFPKIKACGVQYHPEWMPRKARGFSFFYNLTRRLMFYKMDKLIDYYTKGVRGTDNATAKTNGW